MPIEHVSISQIAAECARRLLENFLGLDPKRIGWTSAGKLKATGQVHVTMTQGRFVRGQVADLAAVYGHVIVGESHHVLGVSFARVLSEGRARVIKGRTKGDFWLAKASSPILLQTLWTKKVTKVATERFHPLRFDIMAQARRGRGS